MNRFSLILIVFCLTTTACISPVTIKKNPPWIGQVEKNIHALEKKFDGEFGVYIKDIKNQVEFSHKASQFWYLSSTIKIPVAIKLLKLVDQGKIDLSEKVTIKSTDYRDGAGPVNWIKPGGIVNYKYLLNQMLKHSDNSATDLIIRRVGLENINSDVSKYVGSNAFGPITTLLDVRKKAYSEFHPKAEYLSNFAFFTIKKQKAPEKKLNELAQQLNIPRTSFLSPDLSSGFAKYYAKHWNSAPLTNYGELLEKLATGKLLSPHSTKVLLGILAKIHTGKKRILKGLPKNTFFSHKTGTQHRQACDVGIAGYKKDKKPKILILVCVKNWGKLSRAEKIMSDVGKIVSQAKLL